jgi:hypothetical protein
VKAPFGRDARFPAPLADELVRALPRIDTAPTSIVAADRAQAELLAIFDRHRHPAGSFLRVYHGITVAVIAALEEGSLTPRPFFERLAGRFAEQHFDGVKAALGLDTRSDAARHGLWVPSLAFDNAPAAEVDVPLTHFLVGMSCHINCDLAVALDETIRELGHDRDPAMLDAIERGHEFVDAILAREVGSSMDALADELGCPLSRMIVDAELVPVAGRAAMDVIRQWRAATFPAARRLVAAASPDARRREREKIYRDAERTTAELFDFLPHLVSLLRLPEPDRALAAAVRWLPIAGAVRAEQRAPRASRVARRVVRGLDGVGLGAALHVVRSLVVDPAGGALAAANRSVHAVRMTLGLLDVMVRLQRLAA